MSLNNEKLQQIIDVQKETLALVKQTLEAVTLLKDEFNDSIADMNKELIEKIHVVDSYMRNIIEPNQKTLYNKLLELGDQEVEQDTAHKT